MVKRLCPHCMTINCSAAAEMPWRCNRCGKEIPVEYRPIPGSRKILRAI